MKTFRFIVPELPLPILTFATPLEAVFPPASASIQNAG